MKRYAGRISNLRKELHKNNILATRSGSGSQGGGERRHLRKEIRTRRNSHQMNHECGIKFFGGFQKPQIFIQNQFFKQKNMPRRKRI